MVSGQLAVLQTEIINMQTHEALFLPVGWLIISFWGACYRQNILLEAKSNIDQDDCGNNLEFSGCLEYAGWSVGWKCAEACHESNDRAYTLLIKYSGLVRAT